MEFTPNLNLDLIANDDQNWGQRYRDTLIAIDSAAAEHNLDGTHKTINTPNVVTPKITFPDGTLSSSQLVGGTAQTLAAAIALGAEADLGINDFALTQGGRDLLRVDAQRGLSGMLGNIADPLVQIPLRRADDATRLSGIQTFTRAGTGIYTDPSDGLLKVAAINEPRFERMADGVIGILLEGTSENLCLQSQDFTTTWIQNNMATAPSANTTAAPDGTTTAYTLTFDATIASSINQSTALAAGTYTVSIWAKVMAGNKPFTLDAWNLTDGNIESPTLTATTEWQRFSLTFTNAASSDVRIKNGGDGLAGTLIVWGAQVEALPFATSYIPTTSIALTRAADRLSLSFAGNILPNMLDSTIIFDIDTFANNNSITQAAWASYGENYRMLVLTHITKGTYIANGASGDTIFSSPMIAGIVNRFVSINRAGITTGFKDGTLGTPTPLTTNKTGGTPVEIRLGNWNYSFPLYGHIRNFRIYDKALTDSEIGAA